MHVCVYGEHWGGCCFHASHPDALSAHCSFFFASTVRVFASLCVCVRNTALQVPAASSSLVTWCTSPHSLQTHTRFLKEQDSIGAAALWWPDSIILNNRNTKSICWRETYLVQSLKRSLHGLCSSLSRHPATTSWGTSGRWAADFRVTKRRQRVRQADTQTGGQEQREMMGCNLAARAKKTDQNINSQLVPCCLRTCIVWLGVHGITAVVKPHLTFVSFVSSFRMARML